MLVKKIAIKRKLDRRSRSSSIDAGKAAKRRVSFANSTETRIIGSLNGINTNIGQKETTPRKSILKSPKQGSRKGSISPKKEETGQNLKPSIAAAAQKQIGLGLKPNKLVFYILIIHQKI